MFKNTILNCQKCNKLIVAKTKDFEQGSIKCTHLGCGFINLLTEYYYDEKILSGLSTFGYLIYQKNPSKRYPLQVGINTIGHSPTCNVQVERFLHDGKCFISRQHCTIEVLFNKWSGQLRYVLQDGAMDEASSTYKTSLNGTQLNGYLLRNSEKMDITDKNLICLGGSDFFRLEVYLFPAAMLETYLVSKSFGADETQ